MTQRQAVLQLFKMCGGIVTTAQFCSFLYLNERGEQVGLGAEYRRTLTDMRKLGYRFDVKCVARGKWEYRLLPAQSSLFDGSGT